MEKYSSTWLRSYCRSMVLGPARQSDFEALDYGDDFPLVAKVRTGRGTPRQPPPWDPPGLLAISVLNSFQRLTAPFRLSNSSTASGVWAAKRSAPGFGPFFICWPTTPSGRVCFCAPSRSLPTRMLLPSLPSGMQRCGGGGRPNSCPFAPDPLLLQPFCSPVPGDCPFPS